MAKLRKHPIALYLPRIVALLILMGRRIIQAMTNNAWFPTPPILLTDFTAHLDKLEVSEAKVRSGDKSAAAVRDVDRKQVEDDMLVTKAYVQHVASQNPGHESEVITSAAMTERPVTTYHKAQIRAVMGPAPAQVLVNAKSAGRGAAYEWEYSMDGGKTWLGMGITTHANTSLDGAAIGTTYLFRMRVTIGRLTRDWCQPTGIFVH